VKSIRATHFLAGVGILLFAFAAHAGDIPYNNISSTSNSFGLINGTNR